MGEIFLSNRAVEGLDMVHKRFTSIREYNNYFLNACSQSADFTTFLSVVDTSIKGHVWEFDNFGNRPFALVDHEIHFL